MSRSIINENRESKNINLARKLCKLEGYSDNEAQRIVDAVRTDIPNSRLFQCKFLAGVTRMYLQGQIRESSDIMKLNQCLKFIGAHLDEYDYNLNGMSAQEVINRFSTMAAQDLQTDMARSNNTEYNENKSYRIVRINGPDDAEPYGRYTEWCVTDPESGMYNSYTSGGLGLFYFCLRDGFENVPMEKGENCPLDEYGLSMIAVSVNEDGSCNTITCRWNHDNNGNDHVMTVEQLEQLLGRRFYQTFKPRTKEELKRMRMELLDDIAYQAYGDMCNCGIGDDDYFEPLFNEEDEESDSLELYAYSSNCGYDGYEGEAHYIIVDRNADPVIEDLFDYVDYENGSVIVCNNRKYNILVNKSESMMDLRYISDEWYRKILPTPVKGCFYVMNDDKLFNLVSVHSDGVLFGEWYDSIELYRNSHENGTAFAIIQKNRGFNIVTFNGTTVGRPMFQKWRSGIAMGPGGIFIEATQEGSSSPLVNGKPMELYAMNFDKFPYTATQLCGWERGLYKIECGDRIVYIDDDTRNGWKIMAEKDKNAQVVAENTAHKTRSVIITEDMAAKIKDTLYPTIFKFTSALKIFLANLLEDPCGAKASIFFTGNGITTKNLLKKLKDFGIIKRKLGINDHDSEGRPHTARMTVRYTVPKARFQEKADALFAELFENRQLDETRLGHGGLLLEGDSRLKQVEAIIRSEFQGLLDPDAVVTSSEYQVNGNPNTTWLSFLTYSLRHEFGLMTNADVKCLPLVAKLAFSDEVGFQKRDDNGRELGILKRIVLMLKKDDNLFQKAKAANPTFGELYKALKPQLENEMQAEREAADSVEEHGGYEIVEVPDFKTANFYGDRSCSQSKLCYTQGKSTWDSWTNKGLNRVYVCLRDGWENEPEVPGDGNPYDAYGTSMIFAFVSPDGDLVRSNCRWNHHVEGKYGPGGCDQAFTEETLARTVGRRFGTTFLPWPPEKLRAMGYVSFEDAERRVMAGEDPRDVFDECLDFSEGYAVVGLNNKYNFIGRDGKLVSPNQWFDECWKFREGYAAVGLNGKYNLIGKDGRFVLPNQWFDWCNVFHEGYAAVRLNGKYNLIGKDGRFVSPNQWFDNCGSFSEGYAQVELNGVYNFIGTDGEFLSPNQWFDECSIFIEGYAAVELNGVYNFIGTDGRLVSPNQWFDDFSNFREGYASVELNDEWNFIGKGGKLVSPNQWFDWCDVFHEGYAEVELDGKIMYIDTDGNLHNQIPTGRVDEAASCGGVDGNGFGSGEFTQPLFGDINANQSSPYATKKKKKRKRKSISESEARDTDSASAVYVYAKDAKGRWCVLCAKRNDRFQEGGKWNPPMGHRQEGETFGQCAQRECMEESGFNLSQWKSCVKGTRKFPWGVEYVVEIPESVKAESIAVNTAQDGENGKFVWMPVHGMTSDEWAWTCKQHVFKNFNEFIGKTPKWPI